mmetsp:Transcript_28853/g.52768  ORF Transcript_28853/g.52768 Transcript_28853/m.52768 type:complete len:92 (+) Transcript_28853:2-277(+)
MVHCWVERKADLRVGHLDALMVHCWVELMADCLAEMMVVMKVGLMVVKLAKCSLKGTLMAETMALTKLMAAPKLTVTQKAYSSANEKLTDS